MSTLGGSRGERQAKPKFSALDINSLYRTSRVSVNDTKVLEILFFYMKTRNFKASVTVNIKKFGFLMYFLHYTGRIN